MQLLEPAEYQAFAQETAASIAAEVKAIVPGCRVEHVGASSIPGAISKGDIDLCVLVAPAHHAGAVQALQAAGCTVKADTLRTPELCMLLSPRTDVDAALQVVAEGSRFEFFMRFRDALRADPGLVDQYNAVKRGAAGLGTAPYRDAKSTFIQSVLGLMVAR